MGFKGSIKVEVFKFRWISETKILPWQSLFIDTGLWKGYQYSFRKINALYIMLKRKSETRF